MPRDAQTDEERLKARQVREMFGAISARYDLLNHLCQAALTGDGGRPARSRCGNRLDRAQSEDPGRRMRHRGPLDGVCRRRPGLPDVISASRCSKSGADKISDGRPARTDGLSGCRRTDAAVPGWCFDAVVSAFVLRNLANREQGLAEMRRILRPGGVLGILDFSMPTAPVMGALYRFYFLRILPRLGKLISGVDGPYRYLPESVGDFPGPAELRCQIEWVGFRAVEHRLLTGGIAVLLLGIAE